MRRARALQRQATLFIFSSEHRAAGFLPPLAISSEKLHFLSIIITKGKERGRVREAQLPNPLP